MSADLITKALVCSSRKVTGEEETKKEQAYGGICRLNIDL